MTFTKCAFVDRLSSDFFKMDQNRPESTNIIMKSWIVGWFLMYSLVNINRQNMDVNVCVWGGGRGGRGEW